MQPLLILTIIFGSVIAALVIIGSTLVVIIKMLKGDVSQNDKQEQAREAQMIQEMYQALNKMERRVESLETILMDKKSKESSHGTT